MGVLPAVIAVLGLPALQGRPIPVGGVFPDAQPGRPISASTEGAGLPAVSMTGRVRGIAGRVLIRRIITTVGSVFLRLHLRPGIRLVRLGNCTTVLMEDAALQAARMNAQPAAPAVRQPLQPLQPPQPLQHLQRLQPPQPPQRIRVLRGRSISAGTEGAALPAVSMTGRVPAIAGRALTRPTITTATTAFPRLRPGPGILLVQLDNCTTVITRSAALPAVSMDAHPAVVAARRQPPQPPQPPQ